MQAIESVDEVFLLLECGGGEAYFGEPVTVLEHSLQSAWFVRQKGGEDSLVAAALLHDLGHLLHNEGEDVADRGMDTQHEELGAAALTGHLPDVVLDPIRMHVAAKRYLCHANPRYFAALSPASVESLALQGGPMTEQEAAEFLVMAHAKEAVALRHADDAAKVPGLKVPELASYRSLVEQLWN
ncbi:MAG: HD domain-containing protein [Acidobacteriota bacterium]|nr:HD domain-containing protein [Acidobacteriota bacterium]